MTAKSGLKHNLIALVIIFFYTALGHLLNIDYLKVMSFREEGFSVSFVGIAICIITFILLDYFIRKVRKKPKEEG